MEDWKIPALLNRRVSYCGAPVPRSPLVRSFCGPFRRMGAGAPRPPTILPPPTPAELLEVAMVASVASIVLSGEIGAAALRKFAF